MFIIQIKELFKDDFSINQYLNACGITDIDLWLNPTKENLEPTSNYENIDKLCKNLIKAINQDDLIYILIDIDFDGFSSGSVLYAYIKNIRPSCNIKPLFHKSRVHGLNEKYIMDKLLQEKPYMVICPDSASGDIEQHEILFENRIRVLVIDHHPNKYYNPYSIIVNNQMSKNVINKYGSGALVTWKVCKRLDEMLSVKYTKPLVELVYLSLLSDICNMTSLENSLFANYGMKNIKHKLITQLISSLAKDKEVSNTMLSWDIIPKLSACIRSDDQDLKENLFYALATQEQDYIDFVLEKCVKIHSHQNYIIKKYVEDNVDKVDDNTFVIFEECDDIKGEYRGLVASKYVSRFNRPTMLYKAHKGEYTASVRSNIPIKETLVNSGLFTFVGGHDSACGCGFKEDKLDEIKQYFKQLDNIDYTKQVCKSYNANSIPNDLFKDCHALKNQYGKGVEYPTFHIKDIELNTSNLQFLNKYKTTIKFTYCGVNYIREYCSKIWRESCGLNKSNTWLKAECIGKLCLDKYENPTVEIVDIEFKKNLF